MARHGGKLAPTLTDLLLAAGAADRALGGAAGGAPAGDRARARRPPRRHRRRHPLPARRRFGLTVDPVEFRGFRYHTGVCMTIYAPGRHEELGRGGRYICGEAEPATGLTLYPDAVLRAAPPRQAKPRVYLPHAATPPRPRGCAMTAMPPSPR